MAIRFFSVAAILAVSCVLAGFAEAQDASVAAKVDAAVQSWMTDKSIANAEVAVAAQGKIIGSFDHGWKPTDKEPVASLSKMITGLCVADLIDANKLHPQDTLGSLLGPSLAQMQKDPRFSTITVDQLLTHRAGLTKNAFNDATDKTVEQAFASAAAAPLDTDPGTATAYSDTGYLILGYLIQKAVPQPYDKICTIVFKRAGLARDAGFIDPTLTARAPNGGWAIDAEDYAKLASTLPERKPGTPSQNWLQGLQDDPATSKGPCPRFKGGASYGFGFCQQRTAVGTRFYHDGLLHNHPPFYKKTGGSFFYVNEAGIAAVVIFSGENDGDAYKALETSVMAAMPSP